MFDGCGGKNSGVGSGVSFDRLRAVGVELGVSEVSDALRFLNRLSESVALVSCCWNKRAFKSTVFFSSGSLLKTVENVPKDLLVGICLGLFLCSTRSESFKKPSTI